MSTSLSLVVFLWSTLFPEYSNLAGCWELKR